MEFQSTPIRETIQSLKNLPEHLSNQKGSTKIFINKDGSIHSIAQMGFVEFGDTIKNNEKTVKQFNMACRLLKGEELKSKKLKSEEKKEFKSNKEVAKKIVNFYSKQMDEFEKREFAEILTNISKNISLEVGSSQKSLIKANENVINEKIKTWVKDHPIFTENIVAERFNDIANREGHTAEGEDISRHIMGGQLSIYDEGADVFAIHDVMMNNLDGLDNGVETLIATF